jgi:poly-beta-1,6-N-acetyl-D-glucosamine synthase
MGIWEIIFVVSLLLVLVQLFLVILYSGRYRTDERKALPEIPGISVIIPFHNEEKRIGDLIESLNNQRTWNENTELIFINDCSTDGTINLLNATLNRPFRLVSLNEKCGKKKAIHSGVEQAQHAYIVSLDADVKPGDAYFSTVFKLPQTDLLILPVQMTGQGLVQMLGSIEFGWLQLLTFGSKKPLLCNGANLVFKKSAYLETYGSRSDLNEPSGDDVFLMHSFLAAGKDIHRFTETDLAVETPAPGNLRELLHQRRRWLSKVSSVPGHSDKVQGVFVTALQVAMIFSLAGAFYFPWLLAVPSVKLLAETMASLNNRRHGYVALFGVLILHQLWYPLYLLLLVFPIGKEQKWEQAAA